MFALTCRPSAFGGAALALFLGLAAPVGAQTGAAVPGFQPVRPAQPAPAAQQAASDGLPARIAARPQDLPGRFILLREGDRDTGCMVTLDDKARGTKGRKAVLAPACRDQGLVIFDPSGWTFERGRLLLYARKGHALVFDLYADGVWRKDPKTSGNPVGLRKI